MLWWSPFFLSTLSRYRQTSSRLERDTDNKIEIHSYRLDLICLWGAEHTQQRSSFSDISSRGRFIFCLCFVYHPEKKTKYLRKLFVFQAAAVVLCLTVLSVGCVVCRYLTWKSGQELKKLWKSIGKWCHRAVTAVKYIHCHCWVIWSVWHNRGWVGVILIIIFLAKIHSSSCFHFWGFRSTPNSLINFFSLNCTMWCVWFILLLFIEIKFSHTFTSLSSFFSLLFALANLD